LPCFYVLLLLILFVFFELYICRTLPQKGLLSLTTRYNDWLLQMVRKETIITTSVICLIAYTMSLSFVSQAFPQAQSSTTLSAAGTIHIQASPGIGIYQNYQGTTPLTSLNWGTLEPGDSQSITTYIKNEGNTPITLSLQTSNWAPSSAQNYLSVSWTYNDQTINPGQTQQITLNLSVDPTITGITDFSFDITILATA
jgi:hypothetical protein